MTDSIVFDLADNASDAQVAAEAVVGWVSQFDDVVAHIVYDYIFIPATASTPAESVPGALNGVTVQWKHRKQVIEETPEGEPNVKAPVASQSVHVRPGQVITRTKNGFEVSE